MNHPNHEHHHHDQQHEHHAGHKRKGLHRDWRAWAVVVLMLAAMVVYIMSMDESFQPGLNQPSPQMPADAPAP